MSSHYPSTTSPPTKSTLKAPKRTKAQNDRMWPMLPGRLPSGALAWSTTVSEDWKNIFTALWLKTKKLEQEACGIDGVVVLLGVCITSKMRKARA
ncbi:recombination protein NinB [Salmonella enterica subsp. enterica]|nr:recombination protein NinB [Salmonella enterica subsp. enterica]